MSARNKMRPVHPGEILGQELEYLGLSVGDLADAMGVSPGRIAGILGERDGVSEEDCAGVVGVLWDYGAVLAEFAGDV